MTRIDFAENRLRENAAILMAVRLDSPDWRDSIAGVIKSLGNVETAAERFAAGMPENAIAIADLMPPQAPSSDIGGGLKVESPTPPPTRPSAPSAAPSAPTKPAIGDLQSQLAAMR